MKTFIALVLMLLGSAKAFAFSSVHVSPVLEKYKLEGNWREDCVSPISSKNDEIRFRKEPQGTVMYITDEKFYSVYYVLDAESIDERFVRLRVRSSNTTTDGISTIVFEFAGGRFRVYSNISDKGQVFLEKGFNLANKREETFVSRCS